MPPMGKDIPISFNITFLKDAPNPLGVLRSKGKSVSKIKRLPCICLYVFPHEILYFEQLRCYFLCGVELCRNCCL